MEGIPHVVFILAYGFPFYVPAMFVGGFLGYLVKNPGGAFLASLLATQFLASAAWMTICSFPDFADTMYFLLPSLVGSALALWLSIARRNQPPPDQENGANSRDCDGAIREGEPPICSN